MTEDPMKRIFLAAVAVCAMAAPALAADSLNVPAPGSSKAAQRVAVGDRGMAIMSAGINPDGTLVRGEGVTGSLKLGTGVYEVSFGRDITQCNFQVSAGEPGIGSASPRMTGITARSGNANGVFVQVRDNTNTAVDNALQILIFCGR
jgi:hypothetical protein